MVKIPGKNKLTLIKNHSINNSISKGKDGETKLI